MSANRYNRAFATLLITRLFSPDDDSITVPTQALDIAINAVTVDAINFHVTKILLNRNVMDQALRDELAALRPFVTTTRPFVIDFLEAEIYQPVAEALLRQVRSGQPKYTRGVFWAGACILWWAWLTLASFMVELLIVALQYNHKRLNLLDGHG